MESKNFRKIESIFISIAFIGLAGIGFSLAGLISMEFSKIDLSMMLSLMIF